MNEISWELDDFIRKMAEDSVQVLSESHTDLEKLAKSQIRKFWDVLSVEQNSAVARQLAMHQQRKAQKEAEEYETEIQNQRSGRRADRDIEGKLANAKLRMSFWELAEKVVNDDQFLHKLNSDQNLGQRVGKGDLLALQTLFAETLYSEFSYLKALGRQG